MAGGAAVPTPERPRTLDFMECVRIVFDDPAWVSKLLIGTLVTLAGVLLVPVPLLMGYHLRLVRRAAASEPRPLPEWDDWGGLFADGLKVLAVFIPHQVAFFVVVGLPIGVIVLVSGALGEERGGPVVALALFPVIAVAVVLALGFAAYLQAALVRLASSGEIGAAYDLRANVDFLKRNVFNVLLAFGVLLVTNFVAQFGILLCCVGVLPAAVWSQLSFHYALGRAAALDRPGGTTA